jgi:CRISPR-associated protein Cas2
VTAEIRRYLVAYDISLDRTRNRVAKVLKSYGSRAQFSVFLVDLPPAKTQRMLASIKELIDSSSDSVMVCDLGPVKDFSKKRFNYLGAVQETPEDGPLIV